MLASKSLILNSSLTLNWHSNYSFSESGTVLLSFLLGNFIANSLMITTLFSKSWWKLNFVSDYLDLFEPKILTVRRELSYFAKLTNIRESKKFYWKIKFNFLLSGDLLVFHSSWFWIIFICFTSSDSRCVF